MYRTLVKQQISTFVTFTRGSLNVQRMLLNEALIFTQIVGDGSDQVNFCVISCISTCKIFSNSACGLTHKKCNDLLVMVAFCSRLVQYIGSTRQRYHHTVDVDCSTSNTSQFILTILKQLIKIVVYIFTPTNDSLFVLGQQSFNRFTEFFDHSTDFSRIFLKILVDQRH